MKSVRVGSDKQKEAILEIIRRNNEEIEENDYKMFTEDEELEYLYHKLESMKITDEEAQNLLSKNMMREFYRFVQSKDIVRYIKPWTPWWKNEYIKPKIEVIEENKGSNSDNESSLNESNEGFSTKIDKPDTPPPILNEIPSLNTLTKVKPSNLIIYSLIDIFYTYIFLKRLYNGDFDTDIEECINCVFKLSHSLGANSIYKNTFEALDTCIKRSMVPDFNASLDMAISIVGDMVEILSKGRLFVLTLLSDFHHLFANGEEIIKKSKKIMMARRKLLYFIAWANENSDQSFKKLAEEIMNSIQSLRNEIIQ